MRKVAICLSLLATLFIYQVTMAQVRSPATTGQSTPGIRPAIESKDAEATKIEFRTEDGRTTNNVLTDQRGYIVATVSNKGGIQLTDLKTIIQVDGVIIRRDDLTIGPGRSQDLTQSYSFIAAGNHTIELTVDPINKLNETNENNNRIEKVITVTARTYDAEARRIEFLPIGNGSGGPWGARGYGCYWINQGQEADFVGYVSNSGNSTMTRVKIALKVDGTTVREQTVTIEPGGITSLSGRYRFDTTPGRRYPIVFIVDTDNAFQETREDNNRTMIEVDVWCGGQACNPADRPPASRATPSPQSGSGRGKR